MPPREALIVLCVINHPDLMQKHRDLFETLIFETAASTSCVSILLTMPTGKLTLPQGLTRAV